MENKIIKLRKIKISDKKYFAEWWRDEDLLKVTSGMLEKITDKEVDKYFLEILENRRNKQYMITLDNKVIGQLSLEQKDDDWYETKIVIGEKNEQGKGYGAEAIKLLLEEAKHLGIKKIYLEVRPDNQRAIGAYEKCGFRKTEIKKYPENKFLPQTIKMVLMM